MNARKASGLKYNPLLTSTEHQVQDARTPADTSARLPVDTSTSTPADSPTSMTAAKPASERKFTFYFTDEQLDRLDDVWSRMRKRRRGDGQRISKSQIVRVALDALLDGFERDPEKVLALLES